MQRVSSSGLDDHVRTKLELVGGRSWSEYSGGESTLVVLMSTYTERAALTVVREKLADGTLLVAFEALVMCEGYEKGTGADVKVKVLDDDVKWCVC